MEQLRLVEQGISSHQGHMPSPTVASDTSASSSSGPTTATLVLRNSRQQPVSFPVYSDAQVGLAECTFHEHFEETERDEDVDSNEEVLDLAIKGCSRAFLETKRYLPLDSAMRLLSIKTNVKNCYIAQRVAHPELFTRGGHLKP